MYTGDNWAQDEMGLTSTEHWGIPDHTPFYALAESQFWANVFWDEFWDDEEDGA